MTTYYSDNFSAINPATGLEDNTTLDTQKRVDAGIGHGRIRYKRAKVTFQQLSGDSVRMMQFRSSDRIIDVLIHSGNSGDTGRIDIGFRKSGVSHDGELVEANIVCDAKLMTTAIAHASVFGAGVPDADFYRGKPIWEMVSMPGTGSPTIYTEDPMEDWDLSITFDEAFEVSISITVDVLYTSGD
tara:strand:- start:37 stop:591 length:555 start_codon:yes stop_codon:yes gene_type:complete